MHKIISKTKNGKIFKCNKCNAIHIEYKNLNFNFTQKQFKNFTNYIEKLDGEEWEIRNQNSQYKRKIFIPIGLENFNVILNNEELQELKKLFAKQKVITNSFQDLEIQNFKFINYLN